MSTLVSLKNVVKRYQRGKQAVEVLHGVNLALEQGEFMALMGPSGSGKTTLLNLIAGLDQPTEGEVTVAGERIDRLSGGKLAKWRARHIGFVFQFYNLLPVLERRAQRRGTAAVDQSVLGATQAKCAGRSGTGRSCRSRHAQAGRTVRRSAATCIHCPRARGRSDFAGV